MLKQNNRDELIIAHSNLPFPLQNSTISAITRKFCHWFVDFFLRLSPERGDKHLKEHFAIPIYYKTSSKPLVS